VAKYEVTEFPTLSVFFFSEETGDVDATKPLKYKGALKPAEIDTFISGFAPPPKDQAGKSAPSKPVEELKPEVIAVTSDQVLQDKCVNKLGLCFIVFLDPQEEDHAANLAKLQEVADKHYKSFKTFWMDGRAQNNFREALGVSDMLPGGAVYSPNRGIFITYRGGFAVDAIGQFFDEVLTGAIRRSSRLDKLPPLEIVKDEL